MNATNALLVSANNLVGRSAEESVLLNSYFGSLSMSQNSHASVILIHGDSGLGKTKLAETLRPHLGESGRERERAILLICIAKIVSFTLYMSVLTFFVLPTQNRDDGYFIRGKFDQLSFGSANRPYSGISSAFSEYCNAVEQRDRETWKEVAEKLRREIKGEKT